MPRIPGRLRRIGAVGAARRTRLWWTLPVVAAAVAAVVAALLPVGAADAASYPNPGVVRGDVTVHDPSMIRLQNGTYVVYSTHNGLEARISTDRTTFRRDGSAFNVKPQWWSLTSGDPWAPDVSYHNGKYWLYYAMAAGYGKNTAVIAVAVSSTGMPGTWSDRGIVYSSNDSSNFNAIDPSLMVDSSGRWWLVFGSYWTGIQEIRIDPSTGRQIASDHTRYHLATRPDAPYAVEGAALIQHGSSYYLFASYDQCCQGVHSTYNIRVGRSTSPTGPFTDRNGTPMLNGGGTMILASHGRYIGPGGESILHDVDGDLLVYHYYDGDNNGTPTLGVNLLGWDSSGWPYVH